MLHASVPAGGAERLRHERFILLRLIIGGLAIGLAPAYLAWRGALSGMEGAAIIAAILPLAAVVLLSRTGRLDLAHAISASALSLFVCALAGLSGGLASPVLLWLALVPVEAAFLGGRLHVLRAAAIALLALSLFSAFGDDAAGAAFWDGRATALLAMAAVAVATLVAYLLLDRQDEEVREIRSTEGRGRLMLDRLGDLVTWHDPSGNVVFANAGASTVMGAEPDELLGRGLLERVHVADRPLFLHALSEAAHGAGEANVSFRIVFVPRSGEFVGTPQSSWLEMRARRVDDAAAAVVCVMRDVTARRVIDEEMERNHTAALRANDVKDRFLATVSHELRTPLNAIIGFSEMLSTDTCGMLDAERRQEYATIIHSSGHHLLDVVNTLLDISKIESGTMTVEQEEVDLVAMVESCVKLMRLKAEAGGIELTSVLGSGLPRIVGDRRALKQVLLNLLSNAVKFTPAGGRVVLAAVRDGDMVDIAVSDTGIGIAAADLPRLGDAFFQAKGSYDRAYEGTGLGLSVVRGLVGLHGGRLSIESAPGVGTRVGIRLPIGGSDMAARPIQIATFARAPRRTLETKAPVRLTA